MSKIRKEKQSLNRAQQINELKNAFPVCVPDTSKNKKIIKYSDKINWDNVLFLFEVIIDDLLREIDIPTDYKDSDRTKEMLNDSLFQFFQIYYYQLIIVAWNDKQNKNNSLEQFQMIEMVQKYAEAEIKRVAEVIKLTIHFTTLNPIEFYEKLHQKKTDLQKRFSRIFGQKVGEERLKLYGQVFKKNDEYKRSGKGSNFSKAIENVLPKNQYDPIAFRKAFNKFKNRNDLHSYQDFKKKYRL
jgi:hypothetical protein